MAKKTTSFQKTDPSGSGVLSSQLKAFGEEWLLVGEISRHSPATTAARRGLLGRLQWFLNERQLEVCDAHALRLFFKHVMEGHMEQNGRWGSVKNRKPTRPGTSATYDRILRAFFTWLVKQEELEASPMERLPKPVDRPDQIQPFSDNQLERLLAAAKKTRHPKRDEAILLLMLDTGLRASELCALNVGDVDLHGASVTIREGKGGKSRVAPIAPATRRALYVYLNRQKSDAEDALFHSDRGTAAGDGLTRHGLRFLVTRLSKAAGISGVRCSPHTIRNSFAVAYLNAGGNQFSLMNLLGHTDTKMTSRYVKFSQADVSAAHRQFSPVSRLKGSRGK